MNWLLGIGQWFLKILLTGIGVKMGQEQVNEAERQRDAAKLQADTIEKSKNVEVEVADGIAKVKEDAAKQKENRPANDPLGTDDWNAGR